MKEENQWNSLDILPPDKMLEVKDKNGRIAFAQPTYYPFEVVKMPGDELKQWGWRGTPVFHEDNIPKWDGGWMIQPNDGLTLNFDTVLFWREVNWRIIS